MINFRFIVGALAIAAVAVAPTSLEAAKHRAREKASSTHSRKAKSGRSATQRKSRDDSAGKRRNDAATGELNEIERRWNEENVEPELPE